MNGTNKKIVIMAGARTPFGKFGGGLKNFSATQLAVIASKAALERSGIPPAEIDHVIFGNVMQTSSDAAYLARHVGLYSGVPIPVPAYIVNRLCGSGFQSLIDGAIQIEMELAEEVLVGGTENMSQAPFLLRDARFGVKFGKSPKTDCMLYSALTDSYCGSPMAITAENLAVRYEITREETDEYAHRSQMLATKAYEEGLFEEELVAVEWSDAKGREKKVDRDEHFRSDTTLEKLAKLPPVFKKDGVVTAGNASGICDGAAALVMVSEESAAQRDEIPLGYLHSFAVKGVEPDFMGIGPADAIRAALAKGGLKMEDIGLFEVNEAFAAQYLAVEAELGLPRDRTNVNGGAIALGHPLGASGSRIALTLLHEMRRRKVRYGVASACIGGGQGIALVLENYEMAQEA